MGCVPSKLEEEGEAVSICRGRKKQLKVALKRRFALAEAHSSYCTSLFSVAAAIRLFVARHGHASPSSPFLITFPPPCSASPPPLEKIHLSSTNPLFPQQRCSESTQKTIPCSSMTTTTDSCEEEEEEEAEAGEEREEKAIDRGEEEKGGFEGVIEGGYNYVDLPAQPPLLTPSPVRDLGWDFFNVFDGGVGPEVISSYAPCSDEDMRAVREQEGIPDLEEAGDREGEEEKRVLVVEESDEKNREQEEGNADVVKVGVHCANVNKGEHKGFAVSDSPERGRELLEALKDIEDYFMRAYDSGKDVTRMLEANRAHLQSGVREIKENSTKFVQAITWHRANLSRSSSRKSLVAYNSKSTAWKEYKNDLFDECGGMSSGSHSQTLGRLYAWEKKLYEEVKAGDDTRKAYEKKCSQLRNFYVRGVNLPRMDKARATAKNLHSRILVAVKSAESISKRIQKLQDEELKLQILELLQGLSKTWKIMLEAHDTQNRILSEVKCFMCPAIGKFCNDSHRLATLQLEAELHNWRACFTTYIAAQKSYIEALHGWLTKFVIPDVEYGSTRGRNLPTSYPVSGPPLLIICHDWLVLMEKLPDRAVCYAIKSFAKEMRGLWLHQGEEQQQRRKVDTLAKELDRIVFGFRKADNRVLESGLQLQKSELYSAHHHPDEYLIKKKDLSDFLRRKLDLEKAKHQRCMQETQRVTLNGFQTGFSAIFESLTDFSKASIKLYNDLVNCSETAEKCTEDFQVEAAPN